MNTNTNKKMVMYSTNTIYESDDESSKTEITSCVSYNSISDCAKMGNGFIKIALLN